MLKILTGRKPDNYRALQTVILLTVIWIANVQAQDQQPANDAENTPAPPPASGGKITIETRVVGNQEQPKVLYIVPWQEAKDDTILYQPLNSKVDSIFGHVERSEHRREVEFLIEMDKKDP